MRFKFYLKNVIRKPLCVCIFIIIEESWMQFYLIIIFLQFEIIIKPIKSFKKPLNFK